MPVFVEDQTRSSPSYCAACPLARTALLVEEGGSALSSAEETEPLVTLDSLPDTSLSMSQIDALNESDTIDLVAPLVIDDTTSRITHVDVVIDDVHHYLGWDPTTSQWERILVVEETEDELMLEAARTVSDDEFGDVTIDCDPNENPDIPDIVEFVREYVEYTYAETENLHYVMDEALAELRAAED